MSVYKSINAVQADLAKIGIAKDSVNSFDKYNFRGIDAVYNVLSPLLAKHGLCILPRMIARTCEERASQKGGALFYVTVEAEFDFVCAEDGSKHTVKTYGEAMDRGDKATNKAMSAAYKYAAFQAFAIPTEGDNDADAHTHEVEHQVKSTKISPIPDVSLTDEQAEFAEEVRKAIVAEWLDGNELAALDIWYRTEMDNDIRTYIWKKLAPESKLRAFIRANKPETQAA